MPPSRHPDWGGLWSALRVAASVHASRPAVLRSGDGGVLFTHNQAWERVEGLAVRLRRIGAGCGGRILLLEDNSVEALLLQLAAAGSHSVLIPVNPRLTPRELSSIVRDSSPRWVVCPLTLRGTLDEALSLTGYATQPSVLWTGRSESLFDQLDAMERVGSDVAECTCRRGTPLLVFYTSGTTGAPRGAMFSSRAAHVNAEGLSQALQLCSSDVWGHFAPLCHVADACVVYPVSLAGGAHVLFPLGSRFEPDSVASVIRNCRVTLTFLAPTMVSFLLDVLPSADILQSLRFLMWGSAPCSSELRERAASVLPGRFAGNYGMTETGGPIALGHLVPNFNTLSVEEQGRAGLPLPHLSVRVVDRSGVVAMDGFTRGEVQVRGEGLMMGYLGLAPREEEWLCTGDLAVVMGDGCLQVVGRKKDVIIVGGQNVVPCEVEDVICQHPLVLEAAVCGLPCSVMGEVVGAIFVPRSETLVGCPFPCTLCVVAGGSDGPSSHELARHCAGLLAGYKSPRVFVPQPALPRTPTGKLRQSVVRSMLLLAVRKGEGVGWC